MIISNNVSFVERVNTTNNEYINDFTINQTSYSSGQWIEIKKRVGVFHRYVLFKNETRLMAMGSLSPMSNCKKIQSYLNDYVASTIVLERKIVVINIGWFKKISVEIPTLIQFNMQKKGIFLLKRED